MRSLSLADIRHGATIAFTGALAAMALVACASSPKAADTQSAHGTSACPSYVNDSTMSVVHAPGRVIVVWSVASSLFHDTTRAERYVRALAKRTSQELVALYPGSKAVYVEELQGASFTLSSNNMAHLDEVRTELDRAVQRFQDGVCKGLITARPRGPQPSIAAMNP